MKIIKTKKRVPYVEQVQATECGLCSVAMLLRYYNSYESLNDLRTYIDTGRDGATFQQLRKLMTELNFDAKIYQTNVKNLEKIQLPAIIYWENEHFVVLEKITEQEYKIVDPAVGRRSITKHDFEESYSHYVLTATPQVTFSPKEKGENQWKAILSDTYKNKKILMSVLALSLMTYAITLAIPMVVEYLINHMVMQQQLEGFNTFMIGVAALFIIYGFSVYLRGKKLIDLQQVLDQSLMGKTFFHLLKIPYNFYEVRTSGDLMYRLSSLAVIKELLSEDIISGIIDFGGILFVAGYMFYTSPLLGMIATVLFILNGLFILSTRSKVLELNQNEISESSRLQTIQVESIYSILGVKLAALEDNIYGNWKQQFNKMLGAYRKKASFSNLFGVVNSLLQVAAPFMILLIGIYQYNLGNLSLGAVIAFNTISGTFFGLSTSIFNTYNKYLVASSFLERLRDITETQIEQDPADPVTLDLKGNVTLENIEFSYSKNATKVLKKISLQVPAGKKVAIVGTSGSGKSTLAKLILGLYQPNSGNILYDDTPIEDLSKQELRKQMGIVPQDITLFNKSIFENIRMNRTDISLEEVKEVAKLAQIHTEIEEMPMGYYTLVSEMGMNLSGGQRQRIALARALINKPRVIVLDEATSSLDAINEQKVSHYLSSIGSTRIIIAHRLSTIMDADEIYVMEDGEIIEKGTHEELYHAEGKYYQLYGAQIQSNQYLISA